MIIEPMSRREAVAYSRNSDILKTAVISITEPGAEMAKLADNPQILAVLRLSFFDSNMDRPDAIQEWQAKEIIKFVYDMKDQAEEILVHCEAGQSRSAGVAAALMLWFNGTDDEIMKDPFYYPNKRCYEFVLRAIKESDYKL